MADATEGTVCQSCGLPINAEDWPEGSERGEFCQRRRHSDLRGVTARMLCRYAGLTQREAATVLGVGTGAAIGQQIKRLDVRMRAAPALRRQVTAIESEIKRRTAS